MTKKLKQANREQLNEGYYGLAAQVGDISLQIKQLQQRRLNLLSNMSITLRRIQGMPLPAEMALAIENGSQESVEVSAIDEKDNNGDTEPA